MKKGKSCVLKGYKNFKTSYGTVDSKNLKSIYINIQSWVEPKKSLENWSREVSFLNRLIKQLLLEISDKFIFHSKFRCDLKTLLDKDLDCFSNQIYSIFGYFSYYFTNNNVNKIKCVATEVLRKHQKSNDFLTLIKTKYNLDIEILTGQE